MASVKCFLKVNSPLQDGRCPICIRIIINRKKHEYGLDIYEFPHNFDQHSRRVKKNKDKDQMSYNDKNYIIEQELGKCNDVLYHFKRFNIPLTIDRFLREKENGLKSGSFIDFMYGGISAIKSDGLFSKHTISAHENTLNRLREFSKEILFPDLSYELIQNFDRWLFATHKNDINTRWKHHRNIKKWINEAERKNIKIDNPYKHFIAERADGDRQFLSHQELQKFVHLHNQKILPDHLQRDLKRYLFSFYACGLRYGDTELIKWEYFENGLIKLMPEKTIRKRKVLIIPLHEDAYQYIQNVEGNFFDSVSDTTINENLGEICRLLNIKKHITFHTARHTFATWYLENGGRVEVLQQLLGHSKIETTMVYVHITESRKKESIQIYGNLMKSIVELTENADTSL